jgi:hypothetical protein
MPVDGVSKKADTDIEAQKDVTKKSLTQASQVTDMSRAIVESKQKTHKEKVEPRVSKKEVQTSRSKKDDPLFPKIKISAGDD